MGKGRFPIGKSRGIGWKGELCALKAPDAEAWQVGYRLFLVPIPNRGSS